jgi:hypothetical protein
VRLKATHKNHVWSWDFVMDRTEDGRQVRILPLIDEYTKEALAVYPARRIRANAVIDLLADVMVERGVPAYMRRDHGPERITKVLRNWLSRVGTRTAYILPGSSGENGYCESFNGKRD